jgi:integrase
MPRPVRTVPWIETRNGVHYVNWYAPPADSAAKGRTERLSLRTRDAAEAQARFAAFLAEGPAIFAPKSVQAVVTVPDALDRYFTEHVVPNVSSRIRQEIAIRHLKAYFGDTPLNKVDIPACRGYAAARRAGAVGGHVSGKRAEGSDSTIRRELTVLRAAAGHALRWKRLSAADAPTFELPTENQLDEDAMWLTKGELLRLLRRADGDLKTFIAICYWTGSRRGAIETLTLAQVEADRGRVKLAKPGEKRTNKRRPPVPIFPRMKPYLVRQMKAAEAAGRSTLYASNIDFYKAFRTLCEAEGLGEKGFPHILRHSRATHMLMAGESIYKVAKLLGDTIRTVETRYGHASVEFLAQN